MAGLTDVWAAWVADVNAPPLPSLDQATDLLQGFAPLVLDAEGDAWWLAVAAEYGRLGIIGGAAGYNQLRSEVNQSGEAVSIELFGALASVSNLPESLGIARALLAQSVLDEQAAIPGEIGTIETAVAAETDPVLVRALEFGIREREARLVEVNALVP